MFKIKTKTRNKPCEKDHNWLIPVNSAFTLYRQTFHHKARQL